MPFLVALVFVCCMGGCASIDPVQKTQELLAKGDIKTVIDTYNEYADTAEYQRKDEIDDLLKVYMSDLLLEWNESEESYHKASTQFAEFSKINDEQIASAAVEGLAYITCEFEGDQLLVQAEKNYEQKQYLDTMQYLEKADSKYSQYGRFETLYRDSKLILLQEIGHPSTIAEYEKAIQTLQVYLDSVEDDDFGLALSNLQNELDEYRDIFTILSDATTLYEKESYKESFRKLENGVKKYPDNKKIEYALSSYQYAYMMTVCSELIDLIDEKEYESAEALVNTAIEIYDCAEFQELSKSIRMKTDILFAVKTRFSEAGDYIFKSSKKMVLGDFAEDEQETLLSLGGSVATSILNVDAPLDVRDLAYDVTHWGEGDYFAARLALDAVGILPVIGAIKYIKHLDTAADVVKGADKAVDAIDTAHDMAKAADKASDAAKAAEHIIDTSDVISDVKKKANTVADLTDNFSDYAKKSDVLEDITNEIKKTEKADVMSDAAKNADTVTDAAETYKPIATLNQSLVGKKHPKTGIEFVARKLDFSDGRKLKGVFPTFKSFSDIQLPKEYWKTSFDSQKKYLAGALKEKVSTSSGRKELEKVFDAEQISDILDGIVPEGFVWHHNETEGLMQLVDAAVHNATNHTGGMSLWGVGY